jgi:hypothetical protein
MQVVNEQEEEIIILAHDSNDEKTDSPPLSHRNNNEMEKLLPKKWFFRLFVLWNKVQNVNTKSDFTCPYIKHFLCQLNFKDAHYFLKSLPLFLS